jgi:hypothetical protein
MDNWIEPMRELFPRPALERSEPLFPRPGYRPEGHVPEPTSAPATPAPIAQEHQPRRGDEVDAFIKTARDKYDYQSPQWYALDDLLDDYRLCAYTATPLDRVEEASPSAPGEE